MATDRARSDINYEKSLIAVSSGDGETPVSLWADPVTHALVTSGGGTGGGGTQYTDGAAAATHPIGTQEVFTNGSGVVTAVSTANPLPVSASVTPAPSVISSVNSSTTPLAANATFTGTLEDVTNYASITVGVLSDQVSATNGLQMQQSPDGTNWDQADVYTIPASTGKTFGVQITARYFRLVYTNGTTLQTTFRIQTIYHTTMPNASSVRPQDGRGNDNDMQEVIAYGSVYDSSTNTWSRTSSGNGTTGLGTQRVTLSSDSTGQVKLATGANVIGSISNTSFAATQSTAAALTAGWPTINGEAGDVTGTFTNATQTTSVTANNLDGYGNTLISINGTYGTATAIFEGSDDSGTTWYTVQAARDNTNVIETGYTGLTNISQTWQINNPGFDSLRIRSTAVASGTVNVRLSSSAAPVASGTIVGLGTAIPSGTNIVGKFGIDQTTPGTTNGVTVTDGTNVGNILKSDGTAAGQNSQMVSGTFLEKTGSATGTGSIIASFDVSNYKWAALQLTGFGSATVQFQVSNDNVNFLAIGVYNATATNSSTTSITSNGAYAGPLQYRYLRIQVTTYASGTLVATLEVYTVPPSLGVLGVNASQTGTWNIGGASSAAMADAFANPTNNSVAAFGGVYNGTTWDRARSANSAKNTTGTGLPSTAALGFDGTNYQVISTSTAGVQYVLQRSDTSTLTQVNSSATSVTILASNTARKGATIYNNSTQICYVAFASSATALAFTVPMAASAFFEVPSGYTGIITGIWVSANGTAVVTELT